MDQSPALPIGATIEAESDAACAALVAALRERGEADKSFAFSRDRKRVRLTAQSERQLDRLLAWLRETVNLAFSVGAPEVVCLETLRSRVEISYLHRKPRGERQEPGEVRLVFEPAERGAGSSFLSKLQADAAPFAASIRSGVESMFACGPLRGFAVVDVKAILIAARSSAQDSSAKSLEIAARAAFIEAMKKGGALLEPTPRRANSQMSSSAISHRGALMR